MEFTVYVARERRRFYGSLQEAVLSGVLPETLERFDVATESAELPRVLFLNTTRRGEAVIAADCYETMMRIVGYGDVYGMVIQREDVPPRLKAYLTVA